MIFCKSSNDPDAAWFVPHEATRGGSRAIWGAGGAGLDHATKTMLSASCHKTGRKGKDGGRRSDVHLIFLLSQLPLLYIVLLDLLPLECSDDEVLLEERHAEGRSDDVELKGDRERVLGFVIELGGTKSDECLIGGIDGWVMATEQVEVEEREWVRRRWECKSAECFGVAKEEGVEWRTYKTVTMGNRLKN
jgi:hypothetical protein